MQSRSAAFSAANTCGSSAAVSAPLQSATQCAARAVSVDCDRRRARAHVHARARERGGHAAGPEHFPRLEQRVARKVHGPEQRLVARERGRALPRARRVEELDAERARRRVDERAEGRHLRGSLRELEGARHAERNVAARCPLIVNLARPLSARTPRAAVVVQPREETEVARRRVHRLGVALEQAHAEAARCSRGGVRGAEDAAADDDEVVHGSARPPHSRTHRERRGSCHSRVRAMSALLATGS